MLFSIGAYGEQRVSLSICVGAAGFIGRQSREDSLNEKRIQQVLEIEKQAQSIRDAAVSDAEKLPSKAEQEAQALIEKARADAEEEARQVIAKAQADEETSRIVSEAQTKVQETEALAKKNFDQAVGYVFDRVVGRE
jgi:V/A-type H+/Na+-transporting ATPase subunit G/H